MKTKNLARQKLILLMVSFISFFLTSTAQVQTAKFISMATNTKAYYEYLPEGYSATGTTTYPLILFIHGSGELGSGSATALPSVLNGGLPRLINQGKFPVSFTVNNQTQKFIVISPQFSAWPKNADINAVLDYVIGKYKVNTSKIYITGLSMGGGATWDYPGLLSTNGNRVAAIVPICGAATPNSTKGNNIAKTNLPVWAFHNDNDPTVSLWRTDDFIRYINANSPNPLARKTIFSGNSHDAWTAAYNPSYKENGMNMYEWMLQYSRPGSGSGSNTPPVVNAGADATITLPVNSLQLSATATDADGTIASYNWIKVSGPDGYTYNSTTIKNPLLQNLSEGNYIFRVTVKDNAGAQATDDISVTVKPAAATPPSTGVKYLKINLFGGSFAYSNTEWNNWNVGTSTGTNKTSGTLKFSDGTASSIKTVLSHVVNTSDNGSTYTGTMAPDQVLRFTSYSNIKRTLTITGLTPSQNYNIELYASRGMNSADTTIFSIGSLSKKVGTYRNKSEKVIFTGVTANSSGAIVVNLTPTRLYTYLNGIIITQGSTETIAAVNKSELTQTSQSRSASNQEKEISVVPGETKDRFVLKFSDDYSGAFKVDVQTSEGQSVKAFNLKKFSPGLSKHYLPLENLTPGQYIINVSWNNHQETVIISKF